MVQTDSTNDNKGNIVAKVYAANFRKGHLHPGNGTLFGDEETIVASKKLTVLSSSFLVSLYKWQSNLVPSNKEFKARQFSPGIHAISSLENPGSDDQQCIGTRLLYLEIVGQLLPDERSQTSEVWLSFQSMSSPINDPSYKTTLKTCTEKETQNQNDRELLFTRGTSTNHVSLIALSRVSKFCFRVRMMKRIPVFPGSPNSNWVGKMRIPRYSHDIPKMARFKHI